MQKYCGCVFSEEDRYFYKKNDIPELPEGFTFQDKERVILKKENDLEKITEFLNKQDLKDIYIQDNLENIDCYVLKKQEKIIGLTLNLHIFDEKPDYKNKKLSNEKILIQDFVIDKNFRNKGLGKKLLNQICNNYKQKYERIVAKTDFTNLPFFVKQGFDKFIKQDEKGNLYYEKDLTK